MFADGCGQLHALRYTKVVETISTNKYKIKKYRESLYQRLTY